MSFYSITDDVTAVVDNQVYEHTGVQVDTRFSAGSDVSAMVFDETGERIYVGCRVRRVPCALMTVLISFTIFCKSDWKGVCVL